ncbi:unnamed protein product [Phytophthora fragariaefolia]|uniref:Unnamed protein product n=1 Tax=Phytophthora fragariaefolia TaxID=1490495 RepID=A0A9W6WML5_9STRA|nr:unnamed protein product [Phytophthora fragariaefolia]
MSKRRNPPDGDMVTQLAESRAPTPPSKPSGFASGSSPPDTDVGKTAGPQAISVDRVTALQPLGLLSSGQVASSCMPVVVDIPPREPSDITVRVVGVPATESHNDGMNYLQDGFGGLQGVQMESMGATELAVLRDFFDDNDVIGDFILTPRETALTATGPQLALRAFGTVSLLRKVAAKYIWIKRKLAKDDGAAAVVELQDEVLQLKRDQPFQSSYWIERLAEVRRERNATVAQMRSDFVLLMEEREKDMSSLRSEVQTLKTELEPARTSWRSPASRSQVPFLRTAHVMNSLQDHPTVMMNWPRLRDLLGHMGSGTQVPPEWQTVITVMANGILALQAPPFVWMDPPQDEDDRETKESDPLAPDSFLDLSRGASTTMFGSKSSHCGKRASGSQSPKSHKKPAPDDVQELPSEWAGSTSPCRPEEVPLPLSPGQARARFPGGSGACRGRQAPPPKLPSGRPHHHGSIHDALASFGLRSVDEVRPRRYFTVASVALEGLRETGGYILELQVTPGPSLDDIEIDLLESEDEAEDKAEKDEDYNPHQDLDDGVDDEDDDQGKFRTTGY